MSNEHEQELLYDLINLIADINEERVGPCDDLFLLYFERGFITGLIRTKIYYGDRLIATVLVENDKYLFNDKECTLQTILKELVNV